MILTANAKLTGRNGHQGEQKTQTLNYKQAKFGDGLAFRVKRLVGTANHGVPIKTMFNTVLRQ